MTATARSDDPYDADGAGTSTLELLEGAAQYNRWLVSKLLPFLGSRNLELGAGHGTLTALVAAERDLVASEPSASGRRAMAERFSTNPRVLGIVGDLSELSEQDMFDAIYSANVLEHVADDVSLIKTASKHLRPGGHVVAIVPAGGWLYSPFDASLGHYRRYTRADRIRLSTALAADSKPLALVAFRPFNPVGALGWFVRMRLLRAERIPAADAARFDRLLPVLRVLDRLHVPFGQNLLMAFRKCA